MTEARYYSHEALETAVRTATRLDLSNEAILANEVRVLREEIAALRKDQGEFASDQEHDVDYWRLKAREHWDSCQGALAELERVKAERDVRDVAMRLQERAGRDRHQHVSGKTEVAGARARALLIEKALMATHPASPDGWCFACVLNAEVRATHAAIARVNALCDEHDAKQWCGPDTNEIRAALQGGP